MWHKIFFAIVLVAQFPLNTDAHLMDGLYCGRENCYDVLNVTRTTRKGVIGKTYRLLARKFHPDNQATGNETEFKRIANAYEILRDDDARKDYDYMLDNPEAYYQHYYRLEPYH
jgi:DnaJ homolog subfamily C member 25